ncbi:nucleolar protein [Cladophialophora chaetospira]|uniref:Nucleolar protein n=1 Tax=Cladophialophora chaetospira TaxID=386627 RepID=A0AA38X6V7_9EURO|nr:nucleolar protein [Cladophialophora chaetospira]
MGSKKRKESDVIDKPDKKSKKSKGADKMNTTTAAPEKDSSKVARPEKILNVPAADNPEPTSSDNATVVKSKKSRKRAADFMDDEAAAESDGGAKIESNEPTTPDEPAKKKAKKSKKSKKSKDGESLTGDGVNGVIEHTGEEKLETATARKPVSSSMQAEAERTVDAELEDGFGGFASEDEASPEGVEADDNAAALLAGFDSDTEDKEDEGLDLSNMPPLPKSKKLQKKLEKAKVNAKHEGPGTVYVGRIPHGFYEKEMRAYFAQFGDISQLRLSRNKRTGASKHFAFIEFTHDSVAKIAAESMDNYLMFGHILKCKYAEPGSLHSDVWKGANKKFRKIPHEKLEREQLAAPKSEEKWQKKVDKEQRKRDKKAEKLKAIGLDMPASTLTSPSAALKKRLTDQEEPKQIEDEQTAPVGAIEPPPDVPKDEVAVKQAKKSKKEKKSKQEKSDATQAVSDFEPVVDTPEAPAQSKEETKKKKKVKKNEVEHVADPVVDTPEASAQAKTGKKNKKTKKNEVEFVAGPTPAEVSEDAPADEAEPLRVDDEPVLDNAEEDLAASAVNTADGEATNSTEKKLSKAQRKKLSKAEKKVINADRKALQAEKRALRQAEKLAKHSDVTPQATDGDDADEEAPEDEGPKAAADTELSADFISLGQFDDDEGKSKSGVGGGKKIKPWKVKKPKKERKNLVKARGPKSKLVATKPKPDPNAQGKIPGLPVMGKGKYDKATRMAHKELKAKIVAERAARGLPPHRVRGETQAVQGGKPTTKSHIKREQDLKTKDKTKKESGVKEDVDRSQVEKAQRRPWLEAMDKSLREAAQAQLKRLMR